jgi:autotransporter-associated beta strand protein
MAVSSHGRIVRWVVILIVGMPALVSRAQSVWLPTSGTTPWTTGTAWSDGVIPSAVDAVTTFPSAGPTILLDNTTVTVGTINQTTASGNVIIGSTGTAGSSTDWIDLAVSSGVPIIGVSGGNLYMYAQLSGSQGLQKNGGGIYSPRYNTLDFTYTGTNYFNGGTIQIARAGHLGDASNPIEVLASTNLQNYAATTFDAGRSISLAAGTLLTAQNGAAANSLTINGPITGGGSITFTTGNFTLNGGNTYTGTTTIRSATVTLGPASPLSNATLTLQTAAASTGGSRLDLGGQSQTVPTLAFSLASNGTSQATNTFVNGSLTVTGPNLTVNSGAATAQTGTTRLDLTGLSGFSWGNGVGTLDITTSSTVPSSTVATVVSLPTAASSSLSGAHIRVGNSANGPASSTSTLNLGLTNAISTGTLTVGGYRGNGVMTFGADVVGGSLVLRGAGGGDSRADAVYVGFKGGGDNFGNGIFDTSAGSIDARVTSFNVGHYFVLASTALSGSFAMSSGIVDATTLAIGTVNVASGSAGSPTITAVVNQSGGLLRAESLILGVNTAVSGTTNNPNFRSTYAIAGGTLAAGSITSGTGLFAAGSQRRITWTSGTITTLSGSSDLTIAGTSGSGGSILFGIGGADGKSFDVPAGCTTTLGDFVILSGSDTEFVKRGDGTLAVGGTGFVSTYGGTTSVQGGTLRIVDGSALTASRIVPVAGGTVALSAAIQATVGGLAATAGGLTDVGSGLVTVASGLTTADMLVALNSGRGDGSWNGTSGITSSTAAADLAASIPRTVGWLDNGDGSVTFAFAAPGDTNLDWNVDILDAANFLAGGKFDSGTPANWNEGDFGYDGVVDILDAADFLSTGLFDAGTYNPPPGLAAGVATVPEPASLTVLAGAALAAGCATCRRRRTPRAPPSRATTNGRRQG